MKNLKRLIVAFVFACVFAFTALAGETNCPPGEMSTPPCSTDPGQTETPPCSMSQGVAPGQTEAPPADTMESAIVAAIDLFESLY